MTITHRLFYRSERANPLFASLLAVTVSAVLGAPSVIAQPGSADRAASGSITLQDGGVPWTDANRVIHLDTRPVVPGAVEMDRVFEVTLTTDTRRLLPRHADRPLSGTGRLGCPSIL